MLPIFKKLSEKQGNSGVIVQERAPDNDNQDKSAKSMEECGQDLMDALLAKDPQAVGQALYDAARAADAELHEEGEHISPHSYEAQNIKAGQE